MSWTSGRPVPISRFRLCPLSAHCDVDETEILNKISKYQAFRHLLAGLVFGAWQKAGELSGKKHRNLSDHGENVLLCGGGLATT
jgi:hypothetical protein